VALAAFNLPYRQGLLHYAGTVLRGLAEPCRPRHLGRRLGKLDELPRDPPPGSGPSPPPASDSGPRKNGPAPALGVCLGHPSHQQELGLVEESPFPRGSVGLSSAPRYA
jgi:hypothetical protein